MFFSRKRFCNIFLTAALSAAMIVPSASGAYAAAISIGGAELPAKYNNDDYVFYNCIDISTWQSDLSDSDWQDIKDAGVSAVIIRAGYSSLDTGRHNEDKRFAQYIKEAKKAGLDIGVYYFTTALTTDEAKSEAEYLLDIIEPYSDDITLPVAYDFESNEDGRLSARALSAIGPEGCTDIVEAFCDTIADAGYDPMVYASRSVFEYRLNTSKLEDKYKIWMAQYPDDNSATEYDGEFYAWQYSSSIYIDGVAARFDGNYIFEVSEKEKAKDSDPTKIKSTKKLISDEELSEQLESAKADEYGYVSYELDGGVVTKFKKSGTRSNITVSDEDNFVHKYKVYDSDKSYTREDQLLATLFNGYFTSDHEIDPEFIQSKVEPVTISGFNSGDKLSMSGISETLTKLKIENEYITEADDNIFLTIKGHLAQGKPVIMSVDGKTELLVGVDTNGHAVAVDFDNNESHVKLVSVDAYVDKMGERTSDKSTYEKIQQGGYILVGEPSDK